MIILGGSNNPICMMRINIMNPSRVHRPACICLTSTRRWFATRLPSKLQRLVNLRHIPVNNVLEMNPRRQDNTTFSGMEVTFYGTSSATSTLRRNGTCIGLKLEKQSWVFDCADGTTRQLMKANGGINTADISKIFITHLHGDHIFGLPGLLCSISSFQDQEKELAIYGPQGLYRYLSTAMSVSRSTLLHMKITVYEFMPPEIKASKPTHKSKYRSLYREPPSQHPLMTQVAVYPDRCPNDRPVWTCLHDKTYLVRASSIPHTITSFGYVVEEHATVGQIDRAKCQALGLVPGPAYGRLKAGGSVELPDGSWLKSDQVVGPDIPGRKIVILGDTSNAANVVDLATGADVVIHEATLFPNLRRKAVARGHSTADMAGYFAKRASATLLILTHFSARCQEHGQDSVYRLQAQARRAFGRMAVVVAKDFLSVVIPRKKAIIPRD